MGLFSKKKAPDGVPPEVAELPWVRDPAPIDDDFGDPGPFAYASALRAGDWKAARAALAGMTPASRGLALGSNHVQTDPPVDTAERWVAEAPDDGVGHLVLGALHIRWAWEVRGSGYASTVRDDAWDVFFARLQRAESELLTAARLMPTSVEPWNELIWSGIGLQIPLEELAARYDEGQKRDPFNGPLSFSALQMLCEKWHGSHEKMFAFARMVASEAPDGSPAIGVLPMAFLEYVLSRAREVPLDQACSEMSGPEVRRELLAAAERSIFHPSFVEDVNGLGTANAFMVAFYQGEHDHETQRVLDLLRGRYCSSPFDYFGDPGRMCRKAEILTAQALARRV